tara:strand:+ start:79 stop:264 length:186 start_codon:yes stop_codon:yes gene_type:complete
LGGTLKRKVDKKDKDFFERGYETLNIKSGHQGLKKKEEKERFFGGRSRSLVLDNKKNTFVF